MDKNNRGFSYVELLMAALLLSLFAVPILAGFSISIQNLKFADEAYRGGLNAGNLLQEAGRSLQPEHFENPPDLKDLTGNPDFDTEYESDSFDYALTAVELKQDGRVLTIKTGDRDAAVPEFNGEYLPRREPESVVIVYNNGFELQRGAAVVYGHRCELLLSDEGAEIHFAEITQPVEIEVSGGTSSLLIFLNEDADKNLIGITELEDANVTTTFLNPVRDEYLVTAATFSKKGEVLAEMTMIIGGAGQ